MSEEQHPYSRQRINNELTARHRENESLRAEVLLLKKKIAALEAAGDEMSDTLNSTYSMQVRADNQREWNRAKALLKPSEPQLDLRVEELERKVEDLFHLVNELANRKTF